MAVALTTLHRTAEMVYSVPPQWTSGIVYRNKSLNMYFDMLSTFQIDNICDVLSMGEHGQKDFLGDYVSTNAPGSELLQERWCLGYQLPPIKILCAISLTNLSLTAPVSSPLNVIWKGMAHASACSKVPATLLYSTWKVFPREVWASFYRFLFFLPVLKNSRISIMTLCAPVIICFTCSSFFQVFRFMEPSYDKYYLHVDNAG